MPKESFKSFTFLLICQSFSIFGTSLTGFALGVWAYGEVSINHPSKAPMIYTMIALANMVPILLLSPIGGAVADRVNRKKVILAAQIASLTITATLAFLYWHSILRPWHIIALVALNSVFLAFVFPVINATMPLMVSKENLTRANGMIALAFGIIHITSHATAGHLFDSVGIKAIFMIDLVTFFISISAVIITRIPQPPRDQMEHNLGQSFIQTFFEGWRYVFSHKSLRLVVLYYATIVAFIMSCGILIQPMLLAFVPPSMMGQILSISASGIIVGSLLLVVLKGIDVHMPIIIIATICLGAFCTVTPITKDPTRLALGGFFIMMCFPIFDANNRALIQRKVESGMLGRVMGIRSFVMGATRAAMLIIVGNLAAEVFEPSMIIPETGAGLFAHVTMLMPNPETSTLLLSPIAEHASDLFGLGKGRGIALLISLIGIVTVILGVLAFLIGPLRKIDTLMEDTHDMPEHDEEHTDTEEPANSSSNPLAAAS